MIQTVAQTEGENLPFPTLEEFHAQVDPILDRYHEHFRHFPSLTLQDRAMAETLLNEADEAVPDFNMDHFVLKVFAFASRFGPMPLDIYLTVESVSPYSRDESYSQTTRVTGVGFQHCYPRPKGWYKDELLSCINRIFELSPEKFTRLPLVDGSVERLLEKVWLKYDDKKGLWIAAKGQEELKAMRQGDRHEIVALSSYPAAPTVFTDTQNRILEELDCAAMTAEALAKRIGLGGTTIKDALKILKSHGTVVNKRGLGYYRPDKPPQPQTKS